MVKEDLDVDIDELPSDVREKFFDKLDKEFGSYEEFVADKMWDVVKDSIPVAETILEQD